MKLLKQICARLDVEMGDLVCIRAGRPPVLSAVGLASLVEVRWDGLMQFLGI